MPPIVNISFILLIALVQNIGANYAFPDAVVSLWRLDSSGRKPETFITVAALISPNHIFTLRQFQFRPLKTVGFYTGRYSEGPKRMEDSVIIDDLCIERTYNILVVTPAVIRDTTYRIDTPISCYKGNHNGYFIGWNAKNEATIQLVSYKYDYYLQVPKENNISDSDFPVGSFLTMGNDIVAIHSALARGTIRYFRPISLQEDVTMQNTFENRLRLEETHADPYPDAIVSFWRVDEKNVPKVMLCVGALIKPNWILVPSSFFKLSERSDNIRIYTGRKLKKDNVFDRLPNNFINFRIIGSKVIPRCSRLMIVVMEPGIRLPTPYVVTNVDAYGKTYYEGDLTKWDTMVGAMKKKITLNYFQGCFDVTFERESIELSAFPRGSLLVKEKNLIGFLIGNDEAHPVFLLISCNESQAIMNIFEAEEHDRTDGPELKGDQKKKARLD